MKLKRAMYFYNGGESIDNYYAYVLYYAYVVIARR